VWPTVPWYARVPSDDGNPDATLLMNAAAQGNRAAAEALLPLVFQQLRRAAQAQMAAERPGHTLSATALVHEAYLKLAGPREAPWAGRGPVSRSPSRSNESAGTAELSPASMQGGTSGLLRNAI